MYVVSKDGPNTNSTATGWTGDLPLTGLEQGHYVNVMVQILPPSKTLSRTTSLPVSSRMVGNIQVLIIIIIIIIINSDEYFRLIVTIKLMPFTKHFENFENVVDFIS